MVDDVDARPPDAMPDAPPPPRVTTLWPAEATERAGFGAAMAVDGETLVVTATQVPERVGAAYVFVRRDGVWTQQAKLAGDAAALAFGEDVAISGTTIAVTERMDGATPDDADTVRVHLYARSGEQWSLAQTLAAAVPIPGVGGSLALEGNTLVIAARVYGRDGAGAMWTERAALTPAGVTPSWAYGFAAALDGDRVVVSDPYMQNAAGDTTGAVFEFARDGAGAWSYQRAIVPEFRGVWPHAIGFGDDLALRGNRLAIGVQGDSCPFVRVYETSAGTGNAAWNEVAMLDPQHNACGFKIPRIAMSGDRIAIGITGHDDAENPSFRIEGAGYLFRKDGGAWAAMPESVRPADATSTGASIVLAGDEMLVGAPQSGNVYVVKM